MSSLEVVQSTLWGWHHGLRLLVALLATAGLLGMHGLSSDHVMATVGSATEHPHWIATASSYPRMGPETPEAQQLAAPGSDHLWMTGQPAGDSYGIVMGLCVAVLAGSLLLPVLSLLLHKPRMPLPRVRSVAFVSARPARAPPLLHLSPSLSRLCILRT